MSPLHEVFHWTVATMQGIDARIVAWDEVIVGHKTILVAFAGYGGEILLATFLVWLVKNVKFRRAALGYIYMTLLITLASYDLEWVAEQGETGMAFILIFELVMLYFALTATSVFYHATKLSEKDIHGHQAGRNVRIESSHL
jgi:hypothetical protein